MLKGLRSDIHHSNDLPAARRWFADALGIEPYFDEPYYVGFSVAGHELGIVAVDGDPAPAQSYWGVDDLAAELAHLEAAGAQRVADPEDVGGGILMVRVRTPQGLEIGLIENPNDPS